MSHNFQDSILYKILKNKLNSKDQLTPNKKKHSNFCSLIRKKVFECKKEGKREENKKSTAKLKQHENNNNKIKSRDQKMY